MKLRSKVATYRIIDVKHRILFRPPKRFNRHCKKNHNYSSKHKTKQIYKNFALLTRLVFVYEVGSIFDKKTKERRTAWTTLQPQEDRVCCRLVLQQTLCFLHIRTLNYFVRKSNLWREEPEEHVAVISFVDGEESGVAFLRHVRNRLNFCHFPC